MLYIFKEERKDGRTYLVRETDLDKALDKLFSQPQLKRVYRSHYFTDKHMVVRTREHERDYMTFVTVIQVSPKMGDILQF